MPHEPKQITYVGDLLEGVQPDMWVGCCRVSGNHLGGENDVIQVNGELRFGMVLCLPAFQSPGTAATTPAPLALTLKPSNSVPPHMSLALWPAVCAPEPKASKSVSEPIHAQPLKRNAWESGSPQPHSEGMQSPLVFTARCYGDSSSQHWCPGLGSQVWGWASCLLRRNLHQQDTPPYS